MSGYVFSISGDVAKYAQEVGKVPGMTDKAAAAAALKMGQHFAKMQDKAAKEAEKAAKKSAESFEKSAGEIGGSAAKLKGALDLLAPGAGGLAGIVNDLADAAEVLGPELGAVAAGAVVLTGAIVGPIAGATALAAAFTQASFTAEKNLESLQGFKRIGSDFYPSIPASTLESFKALAASQDALASIGDRLSVVIGANVAPSVERAADVVIGLALESEKLVENWMQGESLFESLATGTISLFAQALLLPLKPLVRLNEGIIALADFAGIKLSDSFRESNESLAKFVNGEGALKLGAMAVSAIETSDAYHKMGTALDGVAATGSRFIASQRRATAADEGAAEAAKAATEAKKKQAEQYKAELAEEEKAQESFKGGLLSLQQAEKAAATAQLSGVAAVKQGQNDALAALQATYQATLEQAGGDQQRLQAIQAYEAAKAQITLEWERKLTEAEKAELKKREDDQKAALDKQKALIASYASSGASLFGSMADAAGMVMDAIDPKKHKGAFMAAFAAQKAAAVAQATINTITAISNALALPLPPPAPQLAAVAAGIAGGVQVAKIASAPPPKFHGGTMYASPAGALRAGEFAATLERGEIVVDRHTAARPGVREAVANMATGAPATRATHPDDVAEGMDRSSVPALLEALLGETRRNNNSRPRSSSNSRPGHKDIYAYS